MPNPFFPDGEVDGSPVGIAQPAYTADELALLCAAQEVLERAWEGGHFSDLIVADGSGRGFARSLATMHHAAERAQALVPDGVTVVARSTAVGDKLLVGVRGRP